MGAVKLCRHRRAKTPYFAESVGLRFYSIEELSWYLYENIYLADEALVGEKLYEWLEKELGMKALAERLRKGSSLGSHIYNQVMTILQASEYYGDAELEALSVKIREISGMQAQERMKCKADELLENENYWAAVMEYGKLLNIRQNSRLSVEFYAQVWNNLGCAYARLFLFDKAAGCFEMAHQFQKLEVYKEQAYYARRLSECGQETEKTLEAGISEELIQRAKERLRGIGEKNRQAMERTDAEEFLKQEEKKYGRISGNF